MDDTSEQPRFDLWIPALAGIAFVLRLAHVLWSRANPAFEAPIMDALYHVEWARSFAAGEAFQEGPFFRAPLYPWFLGVLMKLSGGGLLLPRLVQCALGSATTVLTYLVARRAFDRGTARLAGLAVATYWVLIYFDGELLIPTLIVPLDLLALYLTLGLARSRGRGPLLATGCVFGLSAIARPNVLLFLPFVALWLWRRQIHGVRSVVLLTLGVLAPILPITFYNGLVGKDWALVSTQAGVNFWIGNNPESDGATAIVPGTRGGWWEGYHDAIAQAEAGEGRELLPTEVSRHYSGRAFAWMADEPNAALSHLLWKLRLFWMDWELGNNQDVRFFAHHFNPLLAWLPLRFSTLAGFGLMGLVLVLARRGQRDELFPLWGFVLVYCASVVAFFVCSRFRVPVLPLLAILGAHGALFTVRGLRERRWVPAGSALVLAVALGGLSSLLPRGVKTSDANGYWQLGIYALGQGDLRAAEGHLRFATQLDPGNLFARTSLARVLMHLGDNDSARRELQAAFTLDPERADTWEAWLELLGAAGDIERLEADARERIRQAPHLASPHFHLARALQARRQNAEALEELRAATRRDPGHFAANLSLGRLLLQLNPEEGTAEARAAFERALARSAGAPPELVQEARDRLTELGAP